MIEKYVFVEERVEQLYKEDQIQVLETYHFGDYGSAAKVAYDNEEDIQAITATVTGIVNDIDDFSLRNVANVQAEDVSTIEDVRSLHNIPTDSDMGEGTTVCVMDSGIDPTHPLFEDTKIKHVDVVGSGKGDEIGHGTAVAGQILRVAPAVDFVSLRIFGGADGARPDVILRAYEWLLSHSDEIDVVNMSWGAPQKIQEIDGIHNELVRKGVRDVVAAGNSGDTGGSPATAEKAFSVGACTKEGDMAPFSSYNPNMDNPDVTAIGVNNRLAQASGTTMGDDLSGRWVKASGTSFAAPEVCGSVADFVRSHNMENVPEVYEKHADDIEGIQKDGAGLMHHENTMSEPPEEPIPDQGDATVWTMWKGMQDIIYLNRDWLKNGGWKVSRLVNEDGRKVLEFRKK